ncbi:hypothetical protein B5X24_HaOG208497 [Helicoverpa armigera]|uniref:Uncharacterized protein n=1 Tax=Helicoverpa armigera TaxID=29058 RepID=A0A2W1BJP8_HELAM|nr:hypothetical protein B5X24_HaOG208497 [Helicoverpa armigera]
MCIALRRDRALAAAAAATSLHAARLTSAPLTAHVCTLTGLLGAREGCSAACSLPAQRAGGHTRASGARASAAPSCASELPLSVVARDALLTVRLLALLLIRH